MSAPEGGDVPAMTFVIPVRHHDNAPNWERLLHRLMQTAASIAAQTSASWKAMVVASVGSRIPRLPDGFELVRVDLPANANHDLVSDKALFYESVQLDKGRRVLAGMLAAGRTGYFMLVDDDDFVHRGIVRFAEENLGENGWVLRSGYIWTEGSRLLFLHPQFSRKSGTSHIVRSDLYRLPERAEAADGDYIRTMLGSHMKIEKLLAARGTPLARLPFPGAVYRVGHAGSHSRSTPILQEYVLKRSIVTRPRILVRSLGRLRLLNAKVSRDFGIQSDIQSDGIVR
jgi:hypothetical protein